MIRHIFVKCSVVATLLLSIAFPLWAEETVDTGAAPSISMEHLFDLEYHGAKIEGNAGTASEYRYNHPGLGFGLEFKGHVGKKHLYIDSVYSSDRDYLAEGHLDVNGRFKLNLSSERLWHNLEHIPYQIGTPGAREPALVGGATRVDFADQNPSDDYGLRVEIDEAEAIAKLGDYPAHVRFKYWRLQKEGEKQLRFGDDSCTGCHLQSKSRSIDRVTEEFSGAADAHVGFVDVVFEQLIRTFRVKDPIPVDTFAAHSSLNPVDEAFQHSEDPESKLIQSTVSVRTALTGGLVVDGGYTYGKRENNSDLSGLPLGIDGVVAESVYQKAMGNLSYTPLAALTINMRYRMLDLDTENADTLIAHYQTAAAGPPLTFPTRENMDLNRYEYAVSAAWRPVQQMTVKGDYQRETILRGNTGGFNRHSGSTASLDVSDIGTAPNDGGIDPVWELPNEENIDQYRISLAWRPLNTSALRINSWYRYQTSDEPAYGTSFDDKHEAFFGTNYSSKNHWGLTASARALQEENNDHTETYWASTLPVDEASDRKREQQNYDFGLWLNPFKNVMTGVNYGYLRALVKQDLLFGTTDQDTTNSTLDNVRDEVEYLQNSQNYSAFMNVQWLENLSTRVEGYYVRSVAKFKVDFPLMYAANPNPATSDGLTDISRLDVVQQGLNAGFDWNPAERWSVGLTYGIDDYDARNSDIYDGTVQTCMVTLARTW